MCLVCPVAVRPVIVPTIICSVVCLVCPVAVCPVIVPIDVNPVVVLSMYVTCTVYKHSGITYSTMQSPKKKKVAI